MVLVDYIGIFLHVAILFATYLELPPLDHKDDKTPSTPNR
jgi:hypothetical protein